MISDYIGLTISVEANKLTYRECQIPGRFRQLLGLLKTVLREMINERRRTTHKV